MTGMSEEQIALDPPGRWTPAAGFAGSSAHREAVKRLLSSYRAVPTGETVRLAKRTSNLFRERARTRTPGLDVSGLTGVLDVDPVAMTADVAGMCTYEDLVAATLPHGLAGSKYVSVAVSARCWSLPALASSPESPSRSPGWSPRMFSIAATTCRRRSVKSVRKRSVSIGLMIRPFPRPR